MFTSKITSKIANKLASIKSTQFDNFRVLGNYCTQLKNEFATYCKENKLKIKDVWKEQNFPLSYSQCTDYCKVSEDLALSQKLWNDNNFTKLRELTKAISEAKGKSQATRKKSPKTSVDSDPSKSSQDDPTKGSTLKATAKETASEQIHRLFDSMTETEKSVLVAELSAKIAVILS